jgi:argininosuccinate synthase
VLEDPWFDTGSLEMRDMYKLSVAPEDAPNDAECIDLTFENGNCVNVTQVLKMRSAPGGTTSMSSQNLGRPFDGLRAG